jgi:hypothetical protein
LRRHRWRLRGVLPVVTEELFATKHIEHQLFFLGAYRDSAEPLHGPWTK